MALLGGGARVVRRLGLGRRRSRRLAALGIRVPLPAVGAGGDGWGWVLRNAAALTGVPVPGAGAVVAAGRARRRRRATMGAACGAGCPPELAAVAVVAVSRSGGFASPGAGVPDISTRAGRLAGGRGEVSRSAAVLSGVPEPSLRALVARWRAGSVSGTTDSDTDLLAEPVERTKGALEGTKVEGRDGGSGADEDGSGRSNSSETHDWDVEKEVLGRL